MKVDPNSCWTNVTDIYPRSYLKKWCLDSIADCLEKRELFSDFQYGFRPSWTTTHLLPVASDRIARAFNESGVTWAVALDISWDYDRVWHADLLHKLKFQEISGMIFDLILSVLSNKQFQVVLDGTFSQEYPANPGVPQGSILDPSLFLLCINNLPDDATCTIAIYLWYYSLL